MKCTSCGLPLSPARTMTSCPRCGTPIVSEKKSSPSPKQRSFPQAEAWQPLAEQAQLPEIVRSPIRRQGEAHAENDRILTGNAPVGQAQGTVPTAQSAGKGVNDPFQPAGAHVHAPVTSAPAAQTYVAQPAPKLDPMWLPAPAERGGDGSNIQQLHVQGNGGANLGGSWTDEQLKGFPQGAPTPLQSAPLHQELPSPASGHQPWKPPATKATIAEGWKGYPQGAPLQLRSAEAVGAKDGKGIRKGHPYSSARLRPLRGGRANFGGNNNLGFIVAGLCVITGGLILFFVYFMTLGAPGNANNNSAVNTHAVSNASPITASSPVSSPTGTPFPGQKYIDHAQLASRIDPASRQAIQLTTTFKANQNIYVTFQLHPAGQSGAVCLFWYANNRQFATYQLPVVANEQSSYSYAMYRGTGSGYVELYWASTTNCADKVLAQRVNFTVTV